MKTLWQPVENIARLVDLTTLDRSVLAKRVANRLFERLSFLSLPPTRVGLDTPGLHAQGGQRRNSYFNIRRDIPLIRDVAKRNGVAPQNLSTWRKRGRGKLVLEDDLPGFAELVVE